MKINTVNEKKLTAIGYETDIDYDRNYNPVVPVVGKEYFVYGQNNIMTNEKEDFYFSNNENLLNDGMGGNLNENIKRFHGWRGTNNDRSTTAYSVRKCLEVRKSETKRGIKYYVRFGCDLRKEEK